MRALLAGAAGALLALALVVGGTATAFRGSFGSDSGLTTVLADTLYCQLAGCTLTGKLQSSGTDPTPSACGTTPAVTGSDTSGKVTIGTGITTSCTVTFSAAFTNAPACSVSGDNAAIGYAATTTTTVLTITSSADMASDVVSYVCVGVI